MKILILYLLVLNCVLASKSKRNSSSAESTGSTKVSTKDSSEPTLKRGQSENEIIICNFYHQQLLCSKICFFQFLFGWVKATNRSWCYCKDYETINSLENLGTFRAWKVFWSVHKYSQLMLFNFYNLIKLQEKQNLRDLFWSIKCF